MSYVEDYEDDPYARREREERDAARRAINKLAGTRDRQGGLTPVAIRKLIAVIKHDSGQNTYAAHRMLAIEFGRRHGWKLIERKLFGYDTLRSASRGRKDFAIVWPGEAPPHDHPYYYRDAEGRAAAIAVHLYEYEWRDLDYEGADVPRKRKRLLVEHAAKLGFHAEFVNDFPSWWNPGVSRLVVYTPLDIGRNTVDPPRGHAPAVA